MVEDEDGDDLGMRLKDLGEVGSWREREIGGGCFRL